MNRSNGHFPRPLSPGPAGGGQIFGQPLSADLHGGLAGSRVAVVGTGDALARVLGQLHRHGAMCVALPDAYQAVAEFARRSGGFGFVVLALPCLYPEELKSIKTLLRLSPTTRVVIGSAEQHVSLLTAALRAGATGVLTDTGIEWLDPETVVELPSGTASADAKRGATEGQREDVSLRRGGLTAPASEMDEMIAIKASLANPVPNDIARGGMASGAGSVAAWPGVAASEATELDTSAAEIDTAMAEADDGLDGTLDRSIGGEAEEDPARFDGDPLLSAEELEALLSDDEEPVQDPAVGERWRAR